MPKYLLLWVLLSGVSFGATQMTPSDLTALSLEELMNIEVVTLARKEQRLFDASAAVYVISGNELRRTGINTLPDALRLVPGMFVAQVDANKWVVTSRGFAGLFANKLLVLIDGRSVYTSLFSGVFWEVQDIVFEDVERIEVIRGPGGALWGANAVNGIINIITKNTKETTGGYLQVGSGSEKRGTGMARVGGHAKGLGDFRVFGKHIRRDVSAGLTSFGSLDNWHLTQFGGRLDWTPSSFISGQIYRGQVGQSLSLVDRLVPPFASTQHTRAMVQGGHVLGHYKFVGNRVGDLDLQVYYDRSDRREYFLEGMFQTFDVDIQHRIQVKKQLETVWGVGYRLVSDHLNGSLTMSFDPDSKKSHLFSGFVQQDVRFTNQLRLTAGSKVEHNSYTGVEWQPNMRLWWSPTLSQAFWAALGQAVRTPSRADQTINALYLLFPADSLFQGAPPGLAQFSGKSDFRSETVRAFEAGYRKQMGDHLLFDASAFYNTYDHLRSTEPNLAGLQFVQSPPYLLVPVLADNLAMATTYGMEVAMDWHVHLNWRLRAAYSFFDMDLQVEKTSADVITPSFAHETPAHQFNVRSSLDLPHHVFVDVTGRFVDGLPTQNVGQYVGCDAKLSWQAHRNFSFSFMGRNLLQHTQQEFISTASSALPAAVEREFCGVIDWTF